MAYKVQSEQKFDIQSSSYHGFYEQDQSMNPKNR